MQGCVAAKIVGPMTGAATAAFGTQRPFNETDDAAAPRYRKVGKITRPERHETREFAAARRVGLNARWWRLRIERWCRMFFHGSQSVRAAIGGGDNFF